MPKLFDVRIEVEESGGLHVARTILGNNGILFEGVAANVEDAMCDMICNAGVAGCWQMIENNPSLTFDFLSAWGGTKKVVPAAVPICQAYDMFGAAKCGNFCPTRK